MKNARNTTKRKQLQATRRQRGTVCLLALIMMLASFLCSACAKREAQTGQTGESSIEEGDTEMGTTENEIAVNGVKLFYKTLGEGKPVILVHGNGGSHRDMERVGNLLVAAGYRVYMPDSRGQGDNAPLEEYHYADMAEDMYCMIQALHLDKPAFYGWSDGGIIGLLLEINHPGTLTALAVSGANITPEGAGFSAGMVQEGQSPLYQMMLLEPHITPQQLSTVSIPVLVTAGENDMILHAHSQLIADNLPNAEMVFVKGEDHGSYILGNDKMGELLIDFLARNYQ